MKPTSQLPLCLAATLAGFVGCDRSPEKASSQGKQARTIEDTMAVEHPARPLADRLVADRAAGRPDRRLVVDRDGKVVEVTTFQGRPRSATELAALEKGCEQREYDKCTALGEAHQLAGQRAPAERAWRIACDAGFGRACFHLGAMLGNPLLKLGRDKEAVSMMEKACRLGGQPNGHIAACYFLAGCYDRGALGLQRDAGKARRYYEKACRHGHYWACKKVGRDPPPPPGGR